MRLGAAEWRYDNSAATIANIAVWVMLIIWKHGWARLP